MTINDVLFKAILSMDSYSRGYDRAIELPTVMNTTKIGTATISNDSTQELGNGVDSAIGFYALTYSYDENGDGVYDPNTEDTVIAYRGTDYPATVPRQHKLDELQ